MTTLKNRATAMNQVHEFCKAVIEDAVAVLPEGKDSIYKKDGRLNKRARDAMNKVIKRYDSGLTRVIIDDLHNSVALTATQTYDRLDDDGEYNSTGYYSYSVYLVAKYETNADGEQLINSRIPTEDIKNLSTNWTAATLQQMKDEANNIDKQIRNLKSRQSMLNFWVKE